MRIRSGLAAVAISAAALAFVGVGSYAGYTSAVGGNVNITSGSFYLEAAAGTSHAYDPNGETVDPGTTPLPNGCDPNTPGPCSGSSGNPNYYFEVEFSNANPGDTYYFPVTISDGGTLPGWVTSIQYSYTGKNTLAQALTIWICAGGNPDPSVATGSNPCNTGTSVGVYNGDNTTPVTYSGSPLDTSGANVVPGGQTEKYWIVEQFSSSATNDSESQNIVQTFVFNGESK